MTFVEAPGAAPTGSKHGSAGWLGALVSKHACHGTAATGAAVSKAAQSEGGAAAGAGATVADAAAGAGAFA